jgi:uncharacterized protein (DUF58 family)
VRTRPAISPLGVRVAVAAVMFVSLGWALGYVALVMVAAGIVVALTAGAAVTLVVPQLEVERVIEPSHVQRGDLAHGLVAVRNAANRRSRPCDAIDLVSQVVSQEVDPADARTVSHSRSGVDEAAGSAVVRVPALAPGRSVAVPYVLPTHRRGAFQVGPLTLTRHDPFGFWLARRPVGGMTTLFVEPRLHALDPRPAGRTRHLEGPVSESAPRGTQTFQSLREYVPGDDIRRVHWRSTARTGTLMVREHVDTSLPSTVVVFDTRATCYRDDLFEEAVDVAASVVHASLERGFPTRLVTTAGAAFAVRAGQRDHVMRTFLAGVQPTARGDLRAATIDVLRGKEHDAITVIAGHVDRNDLAEVSAMTHRFATSSLVTLRTAPSSAGERTGHDDTALLRWAGGRHLDGATAATALSHWSARVSR